MLAKLVRKIAAVKVRVEWGEKGVEGKVISVPPERRFSAARSITINFVKNRFRFGRIKVQKIFTP